MIQKIFLSFFIFIFFTSSAYSLTLTVDIPDKYNDVNAGDRFFFTLSIKYPENPKRIDLRLNYEVRNDDGELVAQTKVLKAVETQASFIDSILLPENIGSGIHTIDVLINDYGDMNEVVGSSFHVTSKETDLTNTYLLVILISIVILIILIVYDISKKSI